MKKIVLLVVCSMLTISSYSQVDFTSVYQPVNVENPYSDPVEEALQGMIAQQNHRSAPVLKKQVPQYQQVRGYRFVNGNWQIVTAEVFEQNNVIYVHSFLNRDANMWIDAFNAQLYRTTRNDGSVVYDNFVYKTSITGLGYVYF
jgi:hypothetical protein